MQGTFEHHRRLVKVMQNKKAKIHGLASKYGVGIHAREIWAEHPSTRTMTELALTRFGYLTLDEGTNVLVAEGIRDGVVAYCTAKNSGSESEAPIHYLKAFFDRLSTALHYEIFVGECRWQPLTMNLNDMVGGETIVSPAEKKWKHKDITPLQGMLLSFMDEDASNVILKLKPPTASRRKSLT